MWHAQQPERKRANQEHKAWLVSCTSWVLSGEGQCDLYAALCDRMQLLSTRRAILVQCFNSSKFSTIINLGAPLVSCCTTFLRHVGKYLHAKWKACALLQFLYAGCRT